jgi:pimeloyl-ACP methyl ester carboxylesterase
MPSVTLPGGGKLAYRETGSGPPLLLVHGSPGDGRAWSRVAAHLTEHYRLLLPDLPGYGGSDPLPEGTRERTAAMGGAIGALIEACGEPVRLGGHSYGGNVALHAAVSHAAQIQSLALFEPVFFRALQLTGDKQVLAPIERFFSAYADRVAAGESDAVDEMFDYWFGAGDFATLPAALQSALMGAAGKNGLDVRACLNELLTRAQLAGLTKPVLLAYGGASQTAAPAIAKALATLLPLAQLHAIPGAGHGMLDSHASAVAELLQTP